MLKENYAIDVPLDFNIYPRGKWDDQDAIINGWRIDVKGTRKGGHWMLIEWSKLDFRQKENRLAHIYTMFTVDWPYDAEFPTGHVSYQGATSLNKLRPDCETTLIIRKGECIPGTRTKLQADNYAIHFNDLYKHLNHFIMYITEKTPSDALTENYPNPYTGKTVMLSADQNQERIVSQQCNNDRITKFRNNVFTRISVWIKSLIHK